MKFNDYRKMFPAADLGEWYARCLLASKNKSVREHISDGVIKAIEKRGGVWNKGLSSKTDPRLKWSPEARKKCLDDFKTGKRKSWKKGLTKETDSRCNQSKYSEVALKRIHDKYLSGWRPNLKLYRGCQCFRNDLGHFVRSTWEANICRIFNFENIKYEYESKRCRFDLGEHVYICDFYLPTYDIFIEVKGYLYPDAREKLKLVLNKFPNTVFKIIDTEVYTILTKKYSKEISTWEVYSAPVVIEDPAIVLPES